MEINNNQFEVLVVLERERKKLSQREISKLTHLSLGTINKVIAELTNEGLIDKDGIITTKGLKSLEPYRVKRAIFLAAGFGSRLAPITLNLPKGLVLVNGKRIIETTLDAVVKAEIPEIIIIVGYLGEYFETLKNKYPQIKIIKNDKYNEANNISSAYLVKDKISNSYVIESDLYLYNQNIIRKYEYRSNFLGKLVDKTDDWVTKEKIGGINSHLIYGISFYTEKDGKNIEKDLETVYNSPGGKERYWEQTIFEDNKKKYKINIRDCYEGDIVEIDTFNELKQIDKSYDV